MQNRWAVNGKRSSAPPAAPARRLWSRTHDTCARLAPHSGPTEGRAVGWDTAHGSCCPRGRAGLPLVLLELALLGLGAAACVAADETNTRGRPASPPKGRFAIKHPLPAQTSARASNSSPEPEPQKCGFLAIPGTFHFPSPAPCSPQLPLRAVSLPPLPPAESLIGRLFHVSPPDRSCPRRPEPPPAALILGPGASLQRCWAYFYFSTFVFRQTAAGFWAQRARGCVPR